MSKKNLNHKCIICGEEYHSCDTCERIKSFTPWRSICDTFNHYSIYLTIKSFEAGFITKDEAQDELKRLGVTRSSYGDWTNGAKIRLDEIFAPVKKGTKKVAEKDAVVSEELDEINESVAED